MAMAATATTLTRTSPENQTGWNSYASDYQDDSMLHQNIMNDETINSSMKNPLSSRDGNALDDPFPATKERYANRASSPEPENKRSTPDSFEADENDADKWIHRDKLAKIESEELKAAGIILPKTRSQSRSRPRRDRSADKLNGHHRRGTEASDLQSQPRSRKNSTQTFTERTSDEEAPGWDLRLPEEIAEDPGEYWVRNESVGPKGSRLPVAKVSPAPVPPDFLERDAPVPRKTSGKISPEEDPEVTKTKTQPRGRSESEIDGSAKRPAAKRSNTEGSPKKTGNATRKASGRGTSTTRPKTRSGSNTHTHRPHTRSGELSPTSRAPEGDPPWMVSAYKPDPRLPPDQQLLPTVAKRLQQEQWEKEGKFGNVYDTDFRPLNNEGFLQPPELQKPVEMEVEEKPDEWPLRADAMRAEAKSPTPSRPGTSSYSTMPKIQDKPISSPRVPSGQPHPMQVTRIPDPPEPPVEKSSGGCGCCLVM